MHPAYSVILFTSASGAGYGLLAWLALARLTGAWTIGPVPGLVACLLDPACDYPTTVHGGDQVYLRSTTHVTISESVFSGTRSHDSRNGKKEYQQERHHDSLFVFQHLLLLAGQSTHRTASLSDKKDVIQPEQVPGRRLLVRLECLDFEKVLPFHEFEYA